MSYLIYDVKCLKSVELKLQEVIEEMEAHIPKNNGIALEKPNSKRKFCFKNTKNLHLPKSQKIQFNMESWHIDSK